MSDAGENGVRLVSGDGVEMSLGKEDFTVGRSKSCSWCVDGDEISREHCLFNLGEGRAGWRVIDLNSSNGTYVNERRITGPKTLRNGDLIDVGDVRLKFMEPSESDASERDETKLEATQLRSEKVACWMLLADVIGSTKMSQELASEEWSTRIKGWANDCESIIDSGMGVVNEYLGDGFFAFWREERSEVDKIVEVLGELAQYRRETPLDFRVVLHHGTIGIGGAVSSGRESLFGQEVHFVFKAERAVSKADAVKRGVTGRIVLSGAAAEALKGKVRLGSSEDVAVPGFDEPRAFFEFEGKA